MFVLWLCIAAHPQLTKLLTVYSQYETVARGAYTAWGLWFILHLVYSTLVLSVWFCLSEHRSNLIRSPTRSRSSPRLGPTGDFRFLWQFASGKVHATSPFFVRFRFSSFIISCSYMRSDWTAWKDRFYIWEGYEVWAKLEKQGARAERKNGSEEDLSREFRGRWEVYVVVVVIAVWCCVFG